MSLQDWADNGWLKSHQTDRQEIAALLAIVERDLRDASNPTLSADWQFGIAYNSALKLCTVILFSQGFRPENALAHYRTIMALKEIPQQNWAHYNCISECLPDTTKHAGIPSNRPHIPRGSHPTCPFRHHFPRRSLGLSRQIPSHAGTIA